MRVYVIRHAAAGHRDDANPDDLRRPLTARGTAQAAALAERFAARSIEAVYSSPAPRCLQTVAPIAESHRLDIVESDRLLEGRDATDAVALIESATSPRAALVGAGSGAESGDIVLCSHGDVIPDLIRTLQRRGMNIDGGCGWEKASTWTLEDWNGTTFATAAYTPAPPTRSC